MSDSGLQGPITILMAEDDEGHAHLIRMQLREAGLCNPIHWFRDGQQILDFLFCRGPGPHRQAGDAYLLLLDIRMPKVDGEEVLRQVKATPGLCKIPVIVLTSTDDPRAVETCYRLGCSCFITKPVEVGSFFETLRRLGLFMQVVQMPRIETSDPAGLAP